MEKDNQMTVALIDRFLKRADEELTSEERDLRASLASLGAKQQELVNSAQQAQQALQAAQAELMGVRHSIQTLLQLAGKRELSREQAVAAPVAVPTAPIKRGRKAGSPKSEE